MASPTWSTTKTTPQKTTSTFKIIMVTKPKITIAKKRTVEMVFCVVVLVVDLVVEAIVKQNTLKQIEHFPNATLFVYYPFSLPKEIMKIVVA